jgi:hypothetical protein
MMTTFNEKGAAGTAPCIRPSQTIAMLSSHSTAKRSSKIGGAQ